MPNAARILVVNDDRSHTTVMADALKSAGYEVSVAQNAADAIDHATKQNPDLAVLDVRTACTGTSGLELAVLLRDQFAIPFVFLTEIDDQATIQKATAAGALAYLLKTADVRQQLPTLEAAVALAAELRRLRQNEANLSVALQQGREISMAIGVLIERYHIDRDVAFSTLRDFARARRLRVQEVSAQLLEWTERANEVARAVLGRKSL